MPKLWEESVGAHREAVRDATLDAVGALVTERGLSSVTMSAIAQRTGIGRATLYKYFPDIESAVTAWHHRQVNRHLAHLAQVRDQAATSGARLKAVLTAWAHIARQTHVHHGSQLAALLHRDTEVDQAQRQLHDLVRDLLAEAAAGGDLRDDLPADEAAAYCLHALTAAPNMPTQDAVDRLVTLTLTGLRRPDQAVP